MCCTDPPTVTTHAHAAAHPRRFGCSDEWGRAAEQCETADDFARRIWEGMQAKRRAAAAAEAEAFWRRRRAELAARDAGRQKAKEESEAFRKRAQEESRRILDEEQ